MLSTPNNIICLPLIYVSAPAARNGSRSPRISCCIICKEVTALTIYEVKPGDTLTSIARSFGVNARRLAADNGLERPDRLALGQALLILRPEEVYTVRSGDTLGSIAQGYGITTAQLLRNNPSLAAEPLLFAGRELTISFEDKPSRTMRINGYAYPFISPLLLRRELPFLSTLTIFGYGFTDDGALIPADDEPLLAMAKEFGVVPVMLLSSITEGGNFSSERASRLFQDAQLQQTVLLALADEMERKGYRGLDIDFEYVRAEDAEAFLGFIANAAGLMHSRGFFVNVDLAPKSSARQEGLLYEAHDYAAIGALADSVLLMTYEWGYTHGPPMAIAPINQVQRVVDYALTEIPADKILMGVPNYAYDWTLPFIRGTSQAVSISNQYAVTLAGRYNAEIMFSPTAKSPYFNYSIPNGEHVVWFEDVRSINEKLALALSRSLLGLGYWNLMRPFAQNWALLGVTVLPERL